MHERAIVLTLFIILYPQAFSKIIEIACPPHCRCDFFENLKRATCINKKLVVLESNLPNQTELLDLSHNQISHLDDYIFYDQHLLSLKMLNISYNKVSQISMNAFEGLNDMKTVDLSYNALQYLLTQWFWSLKSLQELYLRGNSFGKLQDEPIIESKTLKVLDVSKCAISHIGSDAFIKLSNLEILDISENYLIQLDVGTIRPLISLTVLHVHSNSFSCNNVMEELSDYCANNGIRYRNPCKKSSSGNSVMFERMVEAVEVENEKNSWIYDDGQDEKEKILPETICNSTVIPQKEDEGLLMKIINLSPTLSVLIPFVYGVAVGILIGCSVQIKSKIVGRKSRLSDSHKYFDHISEEHLKKTENIGMRQLRRSNSLFSRKATSEARESLMLKEWDVSESTPMTSRKFQPV